MLILAGEVVFADRAAGATEGFERLAVGMQGFTLAAPEAFLPPDGSRSGVPRRLRRSPESGRPPTPLARGLIEDKASGTQLIQELIADGLYAVTRYEPQSDKVMRMHAQTAMIENGFVHLPDSAPWLAQHLHELTTFPKGRHDDQVDSTAQMLDWFKRGAGPTSNAGIFELYRQLAEEARGQQARGERWVRLCVPPGIGRMNLLHLNVAADGTVEMLESDAQSFLRAGWERVHADGLAGTESSDLT